MLTAEVRSSTAASEIPILLDVDPAVALTRQTVDHAYSGPPGTPTLTPCPVERGSRRHERTAAESRVPRAARHGQVWVQRHEGRRLMARKDWPT
jgi:hypothetical protein